MIISVIKRLLKILRTHSCLNNVNYKNGANEEETGDCTLPILLDVATNIIDIMNVNESEV